MVRFEADRFEECFLLVPERDLGGPGVLGSTSGWRREREREALEDMVEEGRQV